MPSLYISPAGSGEKSGSDINNAASIGSLNTMIGRAGPGGEVLLLADQELGRASCRERVCQYVSIWVVAVALKKKEPRHARHTHSSIMQITTHYIYTSE